MDQLLASLQSQPPFAQALAVSVGGLIGVFATLFLFWGIIELARRVPGPHKGEEP